MPLFKILILVAVILFLADIFFLTDVLAICSYALLAVAAVLDLPLHFLYKIIIGLLVFFALSVAHYLAFRGFIQKVINKYIAPEKYKTHTVALVGKEGVIEIIDGAPSIRIDGELWDFTNQSSRGIEEKDVVKVIDFQDGRVII